uniref:RNase H type-1 domain-containing protein n=1 Tax=Davidia involucrata TaxID=16924 RepID=A0A5B7CCX0_DAVIN
MEDEKDAFYVVRKGDIVGVYKSLSDCQAQLGSSVCNPSLSVFKGYCLPKEAKEYLVSHGLKGGTYAIGAADVQNDLFGELVACPFQQPIYSKGKAFDTHSPEKRLRHGLESGNIGWVGSSSVPANAQRNHLKLDNYIEVPTISSKCLYCILEFDGASKGNPGPAGAGAVLRAEDGSLVYRLREGVGIATNNVAEYRGVILGLKYALKKGFKHIRVQGDSKLVCMQIQGLWKTKNQNMADLCKLAKELVDKFVSFQIRHVERDFNSEADAQANLGVLLKNGEVQDECDMNEYKCL